MKMKMKMKRNVIGILAIGTFLIIAIIAVVFITGESYREKELIISGTIESTQIDINSEVSGKVIEIVNDEGDFIYRGDVIAIVDSAVQGLVVKQFEALVNLKKARLSELSAGARSEEIDQAEVAVDEAETNFSYWKDKYNRTKIIYNSGGVSEADYLDVKYKIEIAEQELKQTQSRLSVLVKGPTNQAIEVAEADLEQTQAQLGQAKLTLDKYKIRSNIDGTYLYRNIELGDIVNLGTCIATVSDLSTLWVRIYIPQKYIGSIALNQMIRMKSGALEDEIQGRIINIADEAEFTPKNTATNESKENTVFKLKIRIVNNAEKLKPGMPIDAFIPLK